MLEFALKQERSTIHFSEDSFTFWTYFWSIIIFSQLLQVKVCCRGTCTSKGGHPTSNEGRNDSTYVICENLIGSRARFSSTRSYFYFYFYFSFLSFWFRSPVPKRSPAQWKIVPSSHWQGSEDKADPAEVSTSHTSLVPLGMLFLSTFFSLLFLWYRCCQISLRNGQHRQPHFHKEHRKLPAKTSAGSACSIHPPPRSSRPRQPQNAKGRN